jgi:16S rRNA processing protein RimM
VRAATPPSKSSTEHGDSESRLSDPGQLLEVGRVVKPHGLKGELVVKLITNRLERVAPGSQLVVGATGDTLVVRASRPFQGRHLVWFEGVSTREAADGLRDATLLAEPLPGHEPDALFVHELIGSELVGIDGTSHGTVVAVQQNPASDLLVGESGWLVPLRFVTGREPGRIVVDVPEGLFE